MKKFIISCLFLLIPTFSLANSNDHCTSTLVNTWNYSLYVAKKACTGWNSAELAHKCMVKLSSEPFNFTLLVAGQACAGGNTAEAAANCLTTLVDSGFAPLVAAPVCAFGNSAREALACLEEHPSDALIIAAAKCFKAFEDGQLTNSN